MVWGRCKKRANFIESSFVVCWTRASDNLVRLRTTANVSLWLLAAAAAWAAPCWDCGASVVPGLLVVRALLSQRSNVMTPSSGISLRVTGFPRCLEAAHNKVRCWQIPLMFLGPLSSSASSELSQSSQREMTLHAQAACFPFSLSFQIQKDLGVSEVRAWDFG